MALVKCEECGNDMSDRAKACPSCGRENNFIFCRECGKKLSSRAFICPECGCAINANAISTNNVEDDKHGIAVAGVICSFLVPLLGLIFGIIALNANKGKSNSSKTMGLIAVIISIVSWVISFFFCMIYFGMMMDYYW